MINVKLIAKTDVEPNKLTSHAAKVCYAAEIPELGNLIDVENRLFKTGHHTTLQHNYFTFCIDNISISAVTFGLHMSSPFYNTDQRSGRFSKMFDNNNTDDIKAYLKHFYPENGIDKAIEFIKKGAKIYADNISKVTEIAAENIKLERPFASEKYIASNSGKFAQEQLRSFISQAVPTGLDFTINLTTLAALYRVAWSPEMIEVTDKMAKIVTELYPDIAYMFNPDKKVAQMWTINAENKQPQIACEPILEVLDIDISDDYKLWDKAEDSVDLLQFSPFCMDNSLNTVKTKVEMSSASMGQDQRHRTIKRSMRNFTGKFYLPPLLKQAGLESVALEYITEFIELRKEVSSELLTAITPYGAMFEYKKLADINALIHEQEKRSCWCAQEEVYHLATALREQLAETGKYQDLLKRLSPPCYSTGKCSEGLRYCGRNIKELKSKYFQKRHV